MAKSTHSFLPLVRVPDRDSIAVKCASPGAPSMTSLTEVPSALPSLTEVPSALPEVPASSQEPLSAPTSPRYAIRRPRSGVSSRPTKTPDELYELDMRMLCSDVGQPMRPMENASQRGQRTFRRKHSPVVLD